MTTRMEILIKDYRKKFVEIEQLEITVHDLEQERDHWRQAYCKAEQETARMEAWSTKLYKEVQELRKLNNANG